MAGILTIAELHKMNLSDLQREVHEQRTHVAKLRLGIKMKKEKDTAKYRREKTQLARMVTVLTEKSKSDSLPKQSTDRTVPSSKKS